MLLQADWREPDGLVEVPDAWKPKESQVFLEQDGLT